MPRRHGTWGHYVRTGASNSRYGGRKNAFDRQLDGWTHEEGSAREYLDYVECVQGAQDRPRTKTPKKKEKAKDAPAPTRHKRVRTGARVYHKTYGEGTVVSVRSDTMVCDFRSLGKMTLAYPDVVDWGVVTLM